MEEVKNMENAALKLTILNYSFSEGQAVKTQINSQSSFYY